MKRVGYIFEKIYNIDNIKLAISKASLGKREQKRVKVVLDDIDRYARYIQRMLINKTYKPTKPTVKRIYDGANKKERIIFKPNFYP